MNICWFENFSLMLIFISLKPFGMLKWISPGTAHAIQGGRGQGEGKNPWAQSETITHSRPLLTVAVRIRWHAVIRDGEAQFPRTRSIISVFQQRSSERTKAIAYLLIVNYLRQQNLFIPCTGPVFTPHAPHGTAVTKVTAAPTVTESRDKEGNEDNEKAGKQHLSTALTMTPQTSLTKTASPTRLTLYRKRGQVSKRKGWLEK